ncbi:MAG: hypothetical protein ABSH42_04190 [Bryobacteraceae bacterium]|jgi:hypothetical protein
MALHVTRVASASPMLAEASIRRPAAGNPNAGQPAVKAATPTLAPQGASSFGSLLASSSAAARPEAAVATTVAKRPTPAASASSAAASDTGTTTAASSSSSTTAASGLSDFELLFGGSSYNPADPMVAAATPSTDSASAAAAPPTAQSVFGPNVWLTDPIGLAPDNTTFEYNPIYFATETTAQTVAQMVGGTVVSKNMITQPGNAFVQQQPNYMVQMPDGALINPGLVASFYTFGFPQSQINTMIAQEVANTPPPAQNT